MPEPNVSLRDYIEQKIKDHIQCHAREHAMLEEALKEARRVMDARLDEMNGLKAQINLERGNFLTVATYDAKHESIVNRLGSVEATLATRVGKVEIDQANFNGRLWLVGFLCTGVGSIIAFAIEKALK